MYLYIKCYDVTNYVLPLDFIKLNSYLNDFTFGHILLNSWIILQIEGKKGKKPYKPIKIIQGKWNCNIYSQVISKGYLHSTILIHNLRIGFSNVKQNKALAGLTFWFCCFRGGARFRVIVLVFPTLAVAAPSAAAHAELSGLLLFESVRIVMPPPGCGLE